MRRGLYCLRAEPLEGAVWPRACLLSIPRSTPICIEEVGLQPGVPKLCFKPGFPCEFVKKAELDLSFSDIKITQVRGAQEPAF